MLHLRLLIGLEGGEVLYGEGIEDRVFFIKDLDAALVDLVGKDLGGGKSDCDLGAANLHLGLRKIHAGLDLPIISEDELLGGEGDNDPIKIIAAGKLGHIGVLIADGSQLVDLRHQAGHDSDAGRRKSPCKYAQFSE